METRIKLLKIVLIIVAIAFTFGLYFLMRYWPDGFAWIPRQHEYEQMILGIYITLGVFLFFAAKDPMKHLSLIWFTAISSLVHGGIMLVQALSDRLEYTNLYGDVPALLIIGIVLVILTPRKAT